MMLMFIIAVVLFFCGIGMGYAKGVSVAEQRAIGGHNHIWDPWQDGRLKVLDRAGDKDVVIHQQIQDRICLDCGFKERRKVMSG